MEGNQKWIVHVDGSSTQHAGGIGVVLQSPEGDKLKHKVRLQYQATNNEVEYEALLKGLELAKSVEAESILVLGDSQLIMGQENGMYKAKEKRMRKYLNRPRRFDIGDLVLKRVSLTTKNPAHGKLGPNWEDPYRVFNYKRQGSYYLEALDGRKLEHPWNVKHLRRYYQ
nr:uncharacterized protein LOC112004164 [Quercus suber]